MRGHLVVGVSDFILVGILSRYVQSARELVYKLLLAADHADVKIAALITWNPFNRLAWLQEHVVRTEGRPEMPAFWIAMTKGDDAAVPSDRLSPGSSEGQMRPMTKVPKI